MVELAVATQEGFTLNCAKCRLIALSVCGDAAAGKRRGGQGGK